MLDPKFIGSARSSGGSSGGNTAAILPESYFRVELAVCGTNQAKVVAPDSYHCFGGTDENWSRCTQGRITGAGYWEDLGRYSTIIGQYDGALWFLVFV